MRTPNPVSREQNPKLDAWLSAIEGSPVPQREDGETIHCDYCNSSVEPDTRMSNYAANELVNPEYVPQEIANRGFQMLRAYCADCNRDRLQYPCKGYHEFIIGGTVSSDLRLVELEILDYSPASAGIEWDPIEAWSITHEGIDWAEYNRAARGMRLGPEDIADAVRQLDEFEVDDVIEQATVYE